MHNPTVTPSKIMVVTGEASGDMHGAKLVLAMRALNPHLSFAGMGGIELERAGVSMLFDAAKIAVVGVTEVLSHLGDILQARRTLLEHMRKERPDLLILIDYPDFNLLLAAKAKKLGIPILYYISPQIWAWRSGRVHAIRRLADRVAVILPFEQEFYARYGYQVDFVGHPLADTVEPGVDRQTFVARYGLDPQKKLIGLLPGSRRKEIASLLPGFLEAAALLNRANPGRYTFLIPQASTIDRRVLEQNGLQQYQHSLDIRVLKEDRYALMAASDAVVAASGTVILELALLNTPTVVAYRISPLTYFLGRLLIRKLQFFSLVNLIGGRAIVPELLQDAVTAERIAKELTSLLENQAARSAMLEGLAEVRAQLGGPGASARAAAIALSMLNSCR